MLIVSLTGLISLENEEEEAYKEMIMQISKENRLKRDASEYIRAAMQYELAKRMKKKDRPSAERLTQLYN